MVLTGLRRLSEPPGSDRGKEVLTDPTQKQGYLGEEPRIRAKGNQGAELSWNLSHNPARVRLLSEMLACKAHSEAGPVQCLGLGETLISRFHFSR